MYKRFVAKTAAFLKGKNGVRCIVVIGVVGILLIFLSEILPSRKNEEESVAADTAAYIRTLEERLTETVSRIDGVGACRVM